MAIICADAKSERSCKQYDRAARELEVLAVVDQRTYCGWQPGSNGSAPAASCMLRDGSNPIYRSLCELADAQGQEAECNSNLSQTCIWYVPSPPPPPVLVHRLYFYTVDNTMAPSFVRCGEVDAARHMPPSLFEPANELALAAYTEAA